MTNEGKGEEKKDRREGADAGRWREGGKEGNSDG